jgi:nitroreductase
VLSEPFLAAWTARYGATPDLPLDAILSPVLEQQLQHRSVRAYSARPLPPGTLTQLIAAAQSASTSSNLQTWSVVAVADAERRARLAQLAGNQPHVRGAPLCLVWLADLSRIAAAATVNAARAEGLEFLESLLLGVIDAALAAQNAVVALEAMGMSCVYIGGIRNHSDQVATELALPPRVFPVFGLCVGYADPTRPAAVKPRLSQSAVLHQEQYQTEQQAAPVAAYDGLLAGFYASQRMPPARWSEQCVDRVRTPEALHGREKLVAALQQLGFALR